MESIRTDEQALEQTAVGRASGGRFARISWSTWIVDGMLLVAAFVGAVYAWPIQREAGRLHAKRMELQRQVGEMPIKDPTKYHVLLLESENPLEFRWRIYIPAKTAAMLLTESRSSTGSGISTSGFSGSGDPAIEGLVIATMMPSGNDSNLEIRVHTRSLHSRGSSSMFLQDESIQQMVNAKDTTSWRIAGKTGVEILSVEEWCQRPL